MFFCVLLRHKGVLPGRGHSSKSGYVLRASKNISFPAAGKFRHPNLLSGFEKLVSLSFWRFKVAGQMTVGPSTKTERQLTPPLNTVEAPRGFYSER